MAVKKEFRSKQFTKGITDVNDIVLVFLLLTLNNFASFHSVSIIDFEQVNISCE